MNSVVSISGLRKSYQGREVLRGVELTLERGRTYFLVGPNGCGKTTTIETAVGLRRPDQGEIRVCGMSPGDPQLRPRIRISLQDAALHAQVTVREHLSFIAVLYGEPRDSVEAIAAKCGITSYLDRRFGRLSGGQKKRVLVASSLLGTSDLIVLDEPTSGVDLESRLELWASLGDKMRGSATTLLVTTHDLNEAEEYSDEVLIMRRGRICAQGTAKKLIEETGLVGVLTVVGEDSEDSLLPELADSRHLLTRDRGSSSYGYLDRESMNAELRHLEAELVPASIRAVRLADAYLYAYRDE